MSQRTMPGVCRLEISMSEWVRLCRRDAFAQGRERWTDDDVDAAAHRFFERVRGSTPRTFRDGNIWREITMTDEQADYLLERRERAKKRRKKK